MNNLGFINKKLVARRSFMIFGRKVKGFIAIPPSLDLEEAHSFAKFMQRSLINDDVKVKFTVITADQGGAIFF